MNRYTLDDVFTYEIREEIMRQFCITYYECAEKEDVRQACKTLLGFVAEPGEDYDGILDVNRSPVRQD